MYKKLLLLFFIVLFSAATILSTFTFAGTLASDQGIAVVVNGERIATDSPAIIKNDRTLVPLRGIFEKLGAEVQWDGKTQYVTITYKTKVIRLQVGSFTAFVGNGTASMDVAPVINKDRVLIPLRFISENIGMNVRWAASTRTAYITDPENPGSLSGKTVLGFTTNDYQGDNASYNSLINYHGNIDSIATFSYQVDGNGNLVAMGLSQKDTVSFAKDKGISSLVLVHNLVNGQFSREISHQLLSDAAKRKKLIGNILDVVRSQGYEGVNVDIENVYWYDRQNYTGFVKELKEKMSANGYLTTLSIPAKDRDYYENNNWNGAFDYAQLGKYADQILLMTYDEHYIGGQPGPVASLPWVERVLEYASGTIPTEKILLGIAGYGYDWSSKGNKALTFKNIQKLIDEKGLAPAWDSKSSTPNFTYYQNGVKHEVWYENEESIALKLDLVGKYHLGGIGIWRLGYDNSAFWSVINEKIG